MIRKTLIATAVASAFMTSAAFAQFTGPSSSQTPYVTPTAAGWSVTSILTVGDTAGNGYKMVGIPDGLGAYDNGNDTFTVLMNHELGAGSGITRAHGASGAFVSEWVINKNTLQVVSGGDLITKSNIWYADGNKYVQDTANTFNRLCSADLPATSAFYNPTSGLGTQARIFMNGEESGNSGRAFATVATGANKGNAYELPRLGNMSFENTLANPYSGNKTVVIGLDDSTPGQVYVYTGNKTNAGSEIDRAGLNNGSLAGIKVNVAAAQGGANNNQEVAQINGAFSTVAIDTNVSGDAQQANAAAAGVTEFARPEDGHWADGKTFYFVTTGATTVGSQTSRLYKLSFNEVAGVVDYGNGTVSMVKDSATLLGTDGATARSFDNMTVGDNGKIYVQEDPGNSQYNAKTWEYNPATGTWTQIFMSDVARFGSSDGTVPATAPYNKDEENSGIIEVTSILGRNDGKRYFLGDMQAHYNISGELVQGGQLYMAAVPEPETYAMMLAGLGLLGFAARRRKTSAA
ncbi:MAG: FxDxF family PEP-CTERM protein [Rhodocyclaceae bacterium]|nr:FxDxF family PEP-CTERM protein [Rhodocyclaceae bacterium]